MAACADLHILWMSDGARATGGEVWRDGGTTWVWLPSPHAELLALFPPPDAEPAGGLARAQELGARRCGCWATGDEPSLAARLRDHGFEEGWRPHWMARDLVGEALPQTWAEGTVEEATEVPEWDGFGQALLTMDRARVFVARADGALAGFTWLHPGEPGSETGALFDLVVFEPFRRRGFGAALTILAARTAASLGLAWLTLNATDEGRALYETLGFESLGDGRTWWRHGGC